MLVDSKPCKKKKKKVQIWILFPVGRRGKEQLTIACHNPKEKVRVGVSTLRRHEGGELAGEGVRFDVRRATGSAHVDLEEAFVSGSACPGGEE